MRKYGMLRRITDSILRWFVRRLEPKAVTVIPVALVLATSAYILLPQLTGSTVRVVVRGSRSIGLRVPSEARVVRIELAEHIALRPCSVILEGAPAESRREVRCSTSDKMVEVLNDLRPLERAASKSALLEVGLALVAGDIVSIRSIDIDGKRLEAAQCCGSLLVGNECTYVDRRYIREDVTRGLTKYNEGVSNWLMTLMGTGWALLNLWLLAAILRLQSGGSLETHIRQLYRPEDLKDRLEQVRLSHGEAIARRQAVWYYLQVLGPALGFIMTISSLVVALRPQVMSNERGLGEFFASVQVALVSTFLGLLLRIWALWLDRMDAQYLLRSEEVFDNIEAEHEAASAAVNHTPPSDVRAQRVPTRRSSQTNGVEPTARPLAAPSPANGLEGPTSPGSLLPSRQSEPPAPGDGRVATTEGIQQSSPPAESSSQSPEVTPAADKEVSPPNNRIERPAADQPERQAAADQSPKAQAV